jgi:hypothetical protein
MLCQGAGWGNMRTGRRAASSRAALTTKTEERLDLPRKRKPPRQFQNPISRFPAWALQPSAAKPKGTRTTSALPIGLCCLRA